MDEAGNTKDDLPLPKGTDEAEKLAVQIQDDFDAGKELVLTVLKVCGWYMQCVTGAGGQQDVWGRDLCLLKCACALVFPVVDVTRSGCFLCSPWARRWSMPASSPQEPRRPEQAQAQVDGRHLAKMPPLPGLRAVLSSGCAPGRHLAGSVH